MEGEKIIRGQPPMPGFRTGTFSHSTRTRQDMPGGRTWLLTFDEANAGRDHFLAWDLYPEYVASMASLNGILVECATDRKDGEEKYQRLLLYHARELCGLEKLLRSYMDAWYKKEILKSEEC